MSADLYDFGPSRVCPCGSEVFKILATFDEDYEIASYSTEAYCCDCGARLQTPLPIHKEV